MNNFIFICEDDLKDLIKQAVILAVLCGNNHNDNNRKDNHNAVQKSKKN